MKTYADIQGWSKKLEPLYTHWAETAAAVRAAGRNTPFVFVEVGCWKGRSTCFLAQSLIRFQVPAVIYAVDTWAGSSGEDAAKIEPGYDLFSEFWANIEVCGFDHMVKPIRLSSLEATALFDHRSVDFVCLDADHSYAAVCRDIIKWWPILKNGGIMGGDDYDWGEVHLAVNQTLRTARFGAVLSEPGSGCWQLAMAPTEL